MATFNSARLEWGTQSRTDLHSTHYHRPVIMLSGVIVWNGTWQQGSDTEIAEQAWQHLTHKMEKFFA